MDDDAIIITNQLAFKLIIGTQPKNFSVRLKVNIPSSLRLRITHSILSGRESTYILNVSYG